MYKDILLTSFAATSDDGTVPPAAVTGNGGNGGSGTSVDDPVPPVAVTGNGGNAGNSAGDGNGSGSGSSEIELSAGAQFDPDQVKQDTIPMQKTGIPILPALVGILSIMGGFIVNRNKQ